MWNNSSEEWHNLGRIYLAPVVICVVVNSFVDLKGTYDLAFLNFDVVYNKD